MNNDEFWGPISEATREKILKDFGSLNDIPYELANSIANICYKIYLASAERNIMNVEKNRISDGDSVWLLDAYEKLKKMIPILRQTPTGTEYDFSVNYMLAMFKYKISNINKKSFLRLKLERIGKNVDEIPDLAKIINVVTN